MGKTYFVLFFVAGELLTLSPRAEADFYKWVDDTGIVNYSATPPTGRDAQKLKARPALSLSPSCASTRCFQFEAYRADQKYRREVRLMDSQVYQRRYDSELAWLLQAREEALAAQRSAWRDRLVRQCEMQRYADCNDDLMLQRLDDLERADGGRRVRTRQFQPR